MVLADTCGVVRCVASFQMIELERKMVRSESGAPCDARTDTQRAEAALMIVQQVHYQCLWTARHCASVAQVRKRPVVGVVVVAVGGGGGGGSGANSR